MTETAAWAVGAIGLSAAAAIDAPSGRWVSDAVLIAAIAALGRIGVAWVQNRRPAARPVASFVWARLGRWARGRAVRAASGRRVKATRRTGTDG